jgi:hypothetical protein
MERVLHLVTSGQNPLQRPPAAAPQLQDKDLTSLLESLHTHLVQASQSTSLGATRRYHLRQAIGLVKRLPYIETGSFNPKLSFLAVMSHGIRHLLH